MVRAILDSSKTQTRRAMKTTVKVNPCDFDEETGLFEFEREVSGSRFWIHSPYGKIGDQLWVRESWATLGEFDHKSPSKLKPENTPIKYIADNNFLNESFHPGRNRPSIFMPRWASRIQLEITGVRVERLNDISYSDSMAEGWNPKDEDGRNPNRYDPKTWYRNLWLEINGSGSWEANPWVWVIEFKVLSK